MARIRPGWGALPLAALLAIPIALPTAGCVGSVEEPNPSEPGEATPPGGAVTPGTPGGAGTPTGGSPVIPPEDQSGCQEAAPLVTAARRLTRDQYVNTVRDLLGDASADVGGQLPKDDLGDDIFSDPRNLLVSPDWASSAMDAAEGAAKAALTKMSALVPCDPANGEQACAEKFITSFGKRAFRRPLDATEVSALGKVYEVGAKNGGFPHGIEVVVRALLQSPSFLYRLELGQKDGSSGSSVRLGQYEVASRLSYLLWNTMPDQELMTAAESGKLVSGDQVLAQARRLLADPRAQKTLSDFHARWLGVDGLGGFAKDPAKYPQFNEKLVESLETELRMFIQDVLFKGDGKLETLLSAKFTYLDASLASLYGVAAPTGAGFSRVELNPAQRGGLLTNAGVITAHTFADESEAIHRGKFVREALLCTIPPEPPADLMVEPPVAKPGVSARQRLAEHASMPACKGCHTLMDPIGFGFEAYDGLGRFRTTDANGKPVDDTGVLDGVKDIPGSVTFHGPLELSQKLAGSTHVRDCLISNVIKFASGLDAAGDTCVQQKLTTAYEDGKRDIRELFLAVTKTSGFRFRRAIAGEVLP